MLRKMATVLCAAAALTAVTAAPQAQAAGAGAMSGAHKLADSDPIKVGLHFTGYDTEAASKLGLEIKTNAAGLQYSVKKGATPAEDAAAQQKAAVRQGKVSTGKVTPQGVTVYNNYYDPSCGNAYIRVTEGAHRDLNLDTGFEINSGDSAWAYRWAVIMVDQGGTFRQPWGPFGLNDAQEWEGHHYSYNLTPGWGYSTIDSPYSYAVLGDASRCTAYPVRVSYHIWP